MAAIDISIFGDKKLEKQFKKLDLKLQKKTIKKALRDSAKIVKNTAKARVGVRSGKLKKSLKVRTEKGLKRGQFGIVVVTGTREELNIDADDKYYYPAAVEFGTKNLPAKPYLRPAIDENRDLIFDLIASRIRSAIKGFTS